MILCSQGLKLSSSMETGILQFYMKFNLSTKWCSTDVRWCNKTTTQSTGVNKQLNDFGRRTLAVWRGPYDLKRATQTRYAKNIAELNSFINCLPFYSLFVYHKISCQECYSYYCNSCHCSQSGIESNLVYQETAILSQIPINLSFEATRTNYKSFSIFRKKYLYICVI